MGAAAVTMLGGAGGRLDRVVVQRCARAGVLVDEGGELSASDVVVRDVRDDAEAGGRFGRGVAAQRGAHAALTRVLVERTRAGGVLALDADVDVTDSVIRDVLPQVSDRAFGNGLVAQGTASARIARTTFERTHEAAVAATGGQLEIEDCLVRETLGVGLYVGDPSGVARVARVRVEGA
ncbi:MAG: hypothetical protein M5U28_21970 [Sandaracinaceae bacterium]|nr:hypothetical protein [Sandaracinaceae bacterium]